MLICLRIRWSCWIKKDRSHDLSVLVAGAGLLPFGRDPVLGLCSNQTGSPQAGLLFYSSCPYVNRLTADSKNKKTGRLSQPAYLIW